MFTCMYLHSPSRPQIPKMRLSLWYRLTRPTCHKALKYIQAHKRLKRTLCIMTKHNMWIFGVSPFFKLQNNTHTTEKQWNIRDVGDLSAFVWAVLLWCFLCPVRLSMCLSMSCRFINPINRVMYFHSTYKSPRPKMGLSMPRRFIHPTNHKALKWVFQCPVGSFTLQTTKMYLSMPCRFIHHTNH